MADEENSKKDGGTDFAAAFGAKSWTFGNHVPPMVPGDSDFGYDEDGNDVTTTMIDETTVAVTVTDEVHNVLDAKLVDVPEGYGELHFKKDE